MLPVAFHVKRNLRSSQGHCHRRFIDSETGVDLDEQRALPGAIAVRCGPTRRTLSATALVAEPFESAATSNQR